MTNLWIQLKFLKQQEVLSTAEAELILKDARDYIDYLEAHIEKPNSKNEIYLCNYLPMANSRLLKTEHGKRSFLSFAGINCVTSSNAILANDLLKWFENQKSCAVLLNNNKLQREFFFGQLRATIDLHLSELVSN